MLFQDLDAIGVYDGIWACSSILHLPKQELLPVIRKMCIALKDNGVIYTSFKYSNFEGERNGRYFTDFTEDTFREFIKVIPELTVEDQWITFGCASGKRRRKMAQSNFAEKSEIEELHIEPTDVMTGDRNKSRYLLYQLKLSMARAKQIDIIVSFLMESGVRMLLSDLKAALQRGVRIRILTGNYLGITQPSALYLLKKELGDKVELRFYSDKGRSFPSQVIHISL